MKMNSSIKVRTAGNYGYQLNCLRWIANSVDPDQTPHSAVSDLGLHCLLCSGLPVRILSVN